MLPDTHSNAIPTPYFLYIFFYLSLYRARVRDASPPAIHSIATVGSVQSDFLFPACNSSHSRTLMFLLLRERERGRGRMRFVRLHNMATDAYKRSHGIACARTHARSLPFCMVIQFSQSAVPPPLQTVQDPNSCSRLF